jgi:hypothetical protein
MLLRKWVRVAIWERGSRCRSFGKITTSQTVTKAAEQKTEKKGGEEYPQTKKKRIPRTTRCVGPHHKKDTNVSDAWAPQWP